MFNIDDWFPNFTFFVIIITPILIAVFFIAIVLSRWIKIRWPTPSPYQQKMAFYIGFAPVCYMFWPLYDIIQYIMGTQSTIVGKLFTIHLPWLMCIIVLTGIGQVTCYAFGARYHDGGD